MTEAPSVSLLFEFMLLTNHFNAPVCIGQCCTPTCAVQQQHSACTFANTQQQKSQVGSKTNQSWFPPPSRLSLYLYFVEGEI